jgi:hypothetical protein
MVGTEPPFAAASDVGVNTSIDPAISELTVSLEEQTLLVTAAVLTSAS